MVAAKTFLDGRQETIQVGTVASSEYPYSSFHFGITGIEKASDRDCQGRVFCRTRGSAVGGSIYLSLNA